MFAFNLVNPSLQNVTRGGHPITEIHHTRDMIFRKKKKARRRSHPIDFAYYVYTVSIV